MGLQHAPLDTLVAQPTDTEPDANLPALTRPVALAHLGPTVPAAGRRAVASTRSGGASFTLGLIVGALSFAGMGAWLLTRRRPGDTPATQFKRARRHADSTLRLARGASRANQRAFVHNVRQFTNDLLDTLRRLLRAG